jgi:hypothetical protein
MNVHIHKTPGFRNDLLAVIPRVEIGEVLLHIVNREKLMFLAGVDPHLQLQDPAERQAVNACKVPTGGPSSASPAVILGNGASRSAGLVAPSTW